MISVDIDPRAVARAQKVLAKYHGRPLQERLQRGTLQAARMLVGPVRAASPVGPTGNLRKSVRAAKSRTDPLAAFVGPKAPHRHLVINPHRIVTPGGRYTGRRTSGNPFVDAAVQSRADDVARIVGEIVFEK